MVEIIVVIVFAVVLGIPVSFLLLAAMHNREQEQWAGKDNRPIGR